jgi:carboxypeptidase C (cathepsin A)
MKTIRGLSRLALLLAVLAATGVFGAAAAAEAKGDPSTRPPLRFESAGQVEVAGSRLRYRALVEESFITNPGGQRTASLVSTSYLRQDARPGRQRPVVFVFNGGPGSAGLWLQMGLAGPRRVDFDDDVNPATVPPFRLADNSESLLDVADIVIFDPPGTGFSRVLPDGKPEEFYGVKQDAGVTLRFIRDWIRRHDRWNSPRFLMGESYGSIRAAVVAKLMMGGPFGSGSMDAITLNGVILLGQALGGDTGEASLANSLPSLAATAWYHGRVDRESRTLDQHVADAREFASTQYIQALYAGSNLDESARRTFAERLASLTGLPEAVVLKNDLRLATDLFAATLLEDDGLQVGKYDSRFVLPLEGSGNDPVADDPAMGQYVPGFVAAVNLHLRDELGVTIDEPYLAIEFHQVNGRWDYGFGPGVPPRTDWSEDLAVAMRRNPALHLFVGTGYYDLVTTVGAADYMVSHAGLPTERVTVRHYESGHMPYLGESSRRRLAGDLRQFIEQAVRP